MVCIGAINPVTVPPSSTPQEYQLAYDTLALAGLTDVESSLLAGGCAAERTERALHAPSVLG